MHPLNRFCTYSLLFEMKILDNTIFEILIWYKFVQIFKIDNHSVAPILFSAQEICDLETALSDDNFKQ